MQKGRDLNLRPETFGYSWFLCMLTGIIGYDLIYYKMPLCVQRLGGFYPAYCTNYIIGMYNVFKYLDAYLPGSLDFWREEFSFEHDNIALNISQLINYRDLYRQYENMFIEALPNKELRHLLHVALYWKPFWAGKFFRLFRFYRKLSKR